MTKKIWTKDLIVGVLLAVATAVVLGYHYIDIYKTDRDMAEQLNIQKMKIEQIGRMYKGDSTTIIYDYSVSSFDTNIFVHKHILMTSPFHSHWYVDSEPTAIAFCKEHLKSDKTNRYQEIESCINLTHMDSTYYIFDTTITEKKHIYDEKKVRVPFSALKLTPKHKGIIVNLISIDGKNEFLGYIDDYVNPSSIQKEWIIIENVKLRKATVLDF